DVAFHRTHALSLTTDLDFAPIGSLGITLTDAVVGTPTLVMTATINAKSYADGSPQSVTLTFAGPFPESQSAGADISAELATDRPPNLDVNLATSLGSILDPLLESTILPGIDAAIQPEL